VKERRGGFHQDLRYNAWVATQAIPLLRCRKLRPTFRTPYHRPVMLANLTCRLLPTYDPHVTTRSVLSTLHLECYLQHLGISDLFTVEEEQERKRNEGDRNESEDRVAPAKTESLCTWMVRPRAAVLQQDNERWCLKPLLKLRRRCRYGQDTVCWPSGVPC
jgi:hypothetical protein